MSKGTEFMIKSGNNMICDGPGGANMNPWKHAREPSTASDKLSREYTAFQRNNPPSFHSEGLDEVRSHYWGHGQKSIIRSKLFRPMKKGLQWSLSPRTRNTVALGFRSIPLIGFDSECAHGVQEKEVPIPDILPPRESVATAALRDTLSIQSWTRTSQSSAPRPCPLRDREAAKLRARPAKPSLYGGSLLLGALVEQEILQHSPRFADAALPSAGRPPGPLIPGFGCLRFREPPVADWEASEDPGPPRSRSGPGATEWPAEVRGLVAIVSGLVA